jgi:hypothetical protein
MQRQFRDRLDYVLQFCVRRAGSGNRESTRALCNCIEQDDCDVLLAELVRRAHKNRLLAEGVRLIFEVSSVNAVVKRFGVAPQQGQGSGHRRMHGIAAGKVVFARRAEPFPLEPVMQAPIVVLNLREEQIFEAATLGYSDLDQMARALSPGHRRIHLAQARWEAQQQRKELENLKLPACFGPSRLN